ncbi:PadR family transcriptional regulator [Listeria ivanovii]|uniref:Transcription regulator PadR N-terminal domain-containing protein n=1 Tax=Listeria ivanovii (strain ATCC BAA-678 / PAM 55) TaxID=881621 RepID=G2ZCY3_LISIP|nr:PadR family transcriptional regulator [Listeria ivanovii]AHI55239.1 PadR family transcriptional regulator [Listeria ivanovii WSLC3009]AIS64693.1 PadR family transcriptional regulator [Listeria ivanovii subsp. ivanovii]MBC1758611.1 helix-turn-helix transcriptional regulator [Listeria ivanovii]MBK3913485.1 helix-turn-helix transcriptional regulator [Listeria ivanovii subsp. ivanovii]MBK3920397.1 helix-turn-helix transcriptional regulator [Listeria ivanovii subsp. ivanovii]
MRGLTELLKGSLEGMILERISRGETYGYEITKYLNDLGFDEIVEGTVYTILLRIEKKGLVEVEKKKSELGPARKFYTLSESGKEELAIFWKRWEFIQAKMIQVKGGEA